VKIHSKKTMNKSKAEENIRVVHMGLTMSRSIKKELHVTMKVALKLIFSFHQQKELRVFPWDVFFFSGCGWC